MMSSEQCKALSATLLFQDQADVNARELAQKIKNFPDLPSKSMTSFELLNFVHGNDLSEIYLNLWTALRVTY